MNRRMNGLLATLIVAGLGTGLGTGACVKAPDIVLTDQKTAFEAQAAGEFRALENDLHQQNIAPKGEDITREAIEASNPESGRSTLGEVAQLYSEVQTDAAWIEQMLVVGCIGEGNDALLAGRADACEREVDSARLTRVVERANLHRRQLWQMMSQRAEKASPADIRKGWREVHLQRVVCGAMVQDDAGEWEKKPC